MADISGNRSSPLQTATVVAATCAALVLLGSVLAYWTWEWLSPPVEPRAPARLENGDGTAAKTWFGVAQGERTAPAAAASGIKLLGVAAASAGHDGHAVLQTTAGKVLAAREGEEISPGVSLAEVHPDHVVLDRSGTRETLAWPRPKR